MHVPGRDIGHLPREKSIAEELNWCQDRQDTKYKQHGLMVVISNGNWSTKRFATFRLIWDISTELTAEGVKQDVKSEDTSQVYPPDVPAYRPAGRMAREKCWTKGWKLI